MAIWKKDIPCQVLSQMHLLASLHVSIVRLHQILDNHLDRAHSQCIGKGICNGRNISLQSVSQSIHAGIGHQLLRHLFYQSGVQNSHIRSDVVIGNRILDASFVIRNDGERGHFSSGAASGGMAMKCALLRISGRLKGFAASSKVKSGCS